MLNKILLVAGVVLFLVWLFRQELKDRALAWYLGLPTPTYTVAIDHNVTIKMKDLISLKADVYRPACDQRFPCILVRTPYGKNHPQHYYEQTARLFASQGYVFIVQDVRGKAPSEGDFYPHRDDKEDGMATLAWIQKQPWSNGKTALFGFSYLGVTAWQAADQDRYPISTLIPWFSGSNPYHLWYDKEVLHLKPLLFWMSTYADSKSRQIEHADVDKHLLQTTQWIDLDKALVGKSLPAYRDFLTHRHFDSFWKSFAVLPSDMKQDIPVLLGSGWYDQFLTSTLADFKALQSAPLGSKKRESCLVIGPWKHTPTQKIMNLNLSAEANFLYQLSTMLKWCGKWMKDKKLENLAPVTYYLMVKNRWCETTDWPPPEVIPYRFYLSCYDQLAPSINCSSEKPLNFHPRAWVPDIGGHMLYSNGNEGPQDQAFLLDRQDVLLWSSDPLLKDLAIVGAPELNLKLFTDLPSFDLAVKLIDVFPNGQMRLITDGYVRLKKQTDSFLIATLKLIDTAYVCAKGHRVQLAITHSHFPNHEPNPDLINLTEAYLSVAVGSEFSHLTLQVLP